MNKDDSQINPYLILGKLFEKDINYKKVTEFVEQYVNIAQKRNKNGDDAIMHLKNLSTELNQAILNSCINLQCNMSPKKYPNPTYERVNIKEAAEIMARSPATIRNWILNKENPLPAINTGKRQTTISLRDLKDYISKIGKKSNLINLHNE